MSVRSMPRKRRRSARAPGRAPQLSDSAAAADPSKGGRSSGPGPTRGHLSDPQVLGRVALGHYAARRFDQALPLLRKATALAPKRAELHTHLGVVLRAVGQLDEAVKEHRLAIELNPLLAEAHSNLGNALRDHGELPAALDAFREALRIKPDFPQAHYNIGITLRDLGHPPEQLEFHYREAIRLLPDYAQAHNELGNLLRRRNSFEAALGCYDRAIECKPSYPAPHLNRAGALQGLGRFDEGIEAIQEALRIDPNLAEAHAQLGDIHQHNGDFEQAAKAYRRAIAINPNLAGGYTGLSTLRGDQLSADEIRTMEQLADRPTGSDEQRSGVLYGLARLYERQGNYDRAFQTVRRANKIERRYIKFSPVENKEFVDRCIQTFSPDYFRSRAGYGDESTLPVFIVGLPRSGSTLVEQIIASHPRAHGGGELLDMPQLVIGLSQNGGLEFPEIAARLDASGSRLLAKQYLDKVRALAPGADRITDKMPFNFRNLGLIASILPKAKVINCRRDPRDVAISCYFIKFLRPISFAYDLGEFVAYYEQYERLMAHWRDVAPIDILDVDYEELVNDPERVVLNILSFCDLEWDERCLAFHQSDRAVRTASSWQVRQPLYSSSVGRWRSYGKYLVPYFDHVAEPKLYPSGIWG